MTSEDRKSCTRLNPFDDSRTTVDRGTARSMPFEYLPIMAQAGAPKPPRILLSATKPAWWPFRKSLAQSRVALLSSAALRLVHQQPFVPREDLSYRRLPADPTAGDLVIDHHSGIGRVPRHDPEMIFPRTALQKLCERGVVGALSPYFFSFMGGLRRPREIENELAPALAYELTAAAVDLVLLVPY